MMGLPIDLNQIMIEELNLQLNLLKGEARTLSNLLSSQKISGSLKNF